MSKYLEVYKAIATLEMSAMQDKKMTVEKAEELRQIIEKPLKEHEQYEAIEEELGLPLNVWLFLAKKQLKRDFSKVYVENTIDDKKQRDGLMSVNGRPQRYIIHIDFEKKLVSLQGTANEWCNRLPFSGYGKTWALTREELV